MAASFFGGDWAGRIGLKASIVPGATIGPRAAPSPAPDPDSRDESRSRPLGGPPGRGAEKVAVRVTPHAIGSPWGLRPSLH